MDYIVHGILWARILEWVASPSPEDLPDPGIELGSPALQVDPLPTELSVQFSSLTQSCQTFCDPMNHSMPGLPVHHQLPEFTQTSIESVMPSSHLILCHPLLLLPPVLPSIRVFSNESTLLMRWPNYWSFSLSWMNTIEDPGLISFRMDWLDLCSPRDSQESSTTPQFKSINSLALSFLHSPTLTSIHDHWKNHSLD